jgi:hypothetical protein
VCLKFWPPLLFHVEHLSGAVAWQQYESPNTLRILKADCIAKAVFLAAAPTQSVPAPSGPMTSMALSLPRESPRHLARVTAKSANLRSATYLSLSINSVYAVFLW